MEKEKEMVKPASVDSNGMKKGKWSEEEDKKLRDYVQRYGHWNWTLLPKYAGLSRSGKSCRLRWLNYLQPGLKRGSFSKEEEDLIIELHAQLGNKFSAIAAKLPGRTDNDIKNFIHGRVGKSLKRYPTAKNQEIDEDKSNNPTYHETDQNESAFFDGLPSLFDTNPSVFSVTEPGPVDSWPESFLANYGQNDYYPPLPEEEEFLYPEFTYNELSSGQSSFWSEHFESNASTSGSQIGYNYIPQEEVGEVCDPFCEYFDHGMNLFD